jgi:hypothetical protein
MALGFFDFLGFGSKRRSALQLFDRTLAQLEVNPAYVDDGMRFAVYKWANLLIGPQGSGASMDQIMREAAAIISFCVIGAEETEALWGAEVRGEREARFNAALTDERDDTLDARLIKLVLAKGIAAPDITARVELDVDPKT